MLLPNRVRAFWPFSTNADAAASTFMPGSSTPALKASTNIDPNPDKGLGDIQTSGGRALLAYAGPSGTIADVVGTQTSDSISIYVVRPGDTLSEIASMFDVSINTIMWANDLKSSRDMHPGDTLVILPISGIERTVVKGDTLKSLAKKYGADADEIASFNGLDSSSPLAIGSTIIIPGGELAVPTPVKNPVSGRVIKEPLHGAGGAAFAGYYSNPVPNAVITQALHGWNGIDLGAARGTPVYAAAGGTIIVARNNGGWNGGYGNYVVITHDNGSQTLYSHLRSTVASFGQSVSGGQLIGYVGATGLVTGPHLHFEVRGAANPLRNCRVGSVCSAQ
ncbi:MAG: M23 family metallopeptidase [Candidatus Pacebacteria bacterium]|nr:M23 family metallopeptidase [Candidatus Paceibacterota bacterium]